MKRILVIGNSDGIGLATTRMLLQQGWSVTGLSRRPSLINNPGYHHTVLDVTAPELRQTLAGLLVSRGPFDVCLYCAGIGEPLSLEDLGPEARTLEVNLMGAIVVAEMLVPAMVQAGTGHLVVLSSLGDGLLEPAAPSYFASKAGLSSYFEALGLRLKRRGVAVTNIRFGFVDTKMAKGERRPLQISADRAAAVILRVLKTRPLRCSYPWSMALFVGLLRWCQQWKVRWASW
jgi:NAD(P)-dependent dehydrogenase (short-subunit alcohol dehydrogenase family)